MIKRYMTLIGLCGIMIVFGQWVRADRVLPNRCETYSKTALLKHEFKRIQSETVQELNKRGIQIVRSHGSVKLDSVRNIRSTFREDPIHPWTAVKGTAQLQLITAKGTVLKVLFKSRYVRSAIFRQFHPHDPWTVVPGFTVGLENFKKAAYDREGNVKGSLLGCDVETDANTMSIEVTNQRSGQVILTRVGGWGLVRAYWR